MFIRSLTSSGRQTWAHADHITIYMGYMPPVRYRYHSVSLWKSFLHQYQFICPSWKQMNSSNLTEDDVLEQYSILHAYGAYRG